VANCGSVYIGFGGVGVQEARDGAVVCRWRGITEGATWERGGGDTSEKGAHLVVFDDAEQTGEAELEGAPCATPASGVDGIGADVVATDGAGAASAGFAVRLEHPGKGAGVGGESGDVGLETSESLVTGDATVRYVDEVKARLGLCAAVHVGGDGEE